MTARGLSGLLRPRHVARRVSIATAVVGTWLVVDVGTAMAQIVESDVDAEPGTTETTQLVTSSTEVRRAVIGLLAVAALAGVLFIVYWYVTGQQARERYARQFAGRHAAAGSRARRPDPWAGSHQRRPIPMQNAPMPAPPMPAYRAPYPGPTPGPPPVPGQPDALYPTAPGQPGGQPRRRAPGRRPSSPGHLGGLYPTPPNPPAPRS